MPDIKNQKLLYHLTSIDNIGSILKKGLKPRAELKRFNDVADAEIIEQRRNLSLEHFVPFHWFCRNPFDGRVQEDRPDEKFVLITVSRKLAAKQNWKIIPHHPLKATKIQLLDYDEGFDVIDWAAMNERNYHDPHCKSVCMSECLSPETVAQSDFFSIFVDSDHSAAYVEKQNILHGSTVDIQVNKNMFS